MFFAFTQQREYEKNVVDGDDGDNDCCWPSVEIVADTEFNEICLRLLSICSYVCVIVHAIYVV